MENRKTFLRQNKIAHLPTPLPQWVLLFENNHFIQDRPSKISKISFWKSATDHFSITKTKWFIEYINLKFKIYIWNVVKLFEKIYQTCPFFIGRNHDFSSRRPHQNFLKIWNLKFLTYITDFSWVFFKNY